MLLAEKTQIYQLQENFSGFSIIIQSEWGVIWLAAILLLATLVASQQSRERERQYAQEDPNSQYVCRGQLSEYAACQCKEDEGELACINAQFVDKDVFLNVNNHYKSLQRITFHGNNFQDLPSTPLFGSNSHNRLISLNISANYIVNLNSNALKGMPNLRILDMSNNEIVLKESDADFLTHTPHLTELYLRKAFTETLNRSVQFDLMMKMFSRANLQNLQVLDMSYNYIHSVPYNLACPFPSLSVLDLRQNTLKDLSLNTTCMVNVKSLDLSRTHITTLSSSFIRMASQAQPGTYTLRNLFHCDCNSVEYITWIRSTNVIKDKNSLVCERASPRNFVGSRLVEVPLKKLDCSVNLVVQYAASYSYSIISLVISLLVALAL